MLWLSSEWARSIEVEMDKGIFVSRAEAESTTLKELLERYLDEITPLKKGAASETNRLKVLMRLPLARRFIAGIRGMDIARFRDGRLHKVTLSTVKRELVLLGHAFEIARKEWGIYIYNPVRDIKLPPENRPRNHRLGLWVVLLHNVPNHSVARKAGATGELVRPEIFLGRTGWIE